MTVAVANPVSNLILGREQWEALRVMAEDIVRSGLLPPHIKTPQAALFVIQKGIELRIPPTYALCELYVVNGRVGASSELMLALIYRDVGDDAIVFRETNEQRCTIAYKRRSWQQYQEFTYTIEDAKRAGLLQREQWQKYPAAMLRARAISAVARMAFPDVIGGLTTYDELVDVAQSEGAPDSVIRELSAFLEKNQGAASRPAAAPPQQNGDVVTTTAREVRTETTPQQPPRDMRLLLKNLAEQYGLARDFVTAMLFELVGKKAPDQYTDEEVEYFARMVHKHDENRRAIAEALAGIDISTTWVNNWLLAKGYAAKVSYRGNEFVSYHLTEPEDIAELIEAAKQQAFIADIIEDEDEAKQAG